MQRGSRGSFEPPGRGVAARGSLRSPGAAALIVALLLSAPAPPPDRHRRDRAPRARLVGGLVGVVPNVRASRELRALARRRVGVRLRPVQPAELVAGVAGVQPDRRGLAPGARWHVQGTPAPTLFRRPEAVGQLLVRDVQAPERLEFHLTGDRLDVELLLEEAGPERTQCPSGSRAPGWWACPGSLPRQALGRPLRLLQTGAA